MIETIPRHIMALWAKLPDRSGKREGYHPLVYHLIDVGMAAEALWRYVLTPAARVDIAARMGLDVGAAERWIAFLAAMHDLGKAAPAFAQMDRRLIARLADSKLSLRETGLRVPHGTISTLALPGILSARGVSRAVAYRLAVAIGGHHGVFPSDDEVRIARRGRDAMGDAEWEQARQSLALALADALDLPEQPVQRLDNAAAFWLAGLVSVADWIGSNTSYFSPAVSDNTVPDFDAAYLPYARRQAYRALAELGWLAQPADAAPVAFTDLFPFKPNALQEAVMEIQDRLTEFGLVIIEAPMGVGKTEAALWLADAWTRQRGQRGFYIGLPTQATSDQMFGRTTNFLRKRFASDVVNVQLLHGHAGLSSEFQALRELGDKLFSLGDIRDEGGAVAAAEWFTYRKRGLLAPFGVGTVDQVLLAILRTRHVFVRLFGLAHKTIIIDEVHAYDVYQSSLLDQLLRWLAALGSTVVLLSATLPDKRRRELALKYAEGLAASTTVCIGEAPYPRLTAAGAHDALSRPLDLKLAEKLIAVRWVDGSLPREGGAPYPLGERLQGALADGGTAAVICNTVRRAQCIHRALEPYFKGDAEDGAPILDLLHARYPYENRMERQERTLRRFGPGTGGRPRLAVLVATQIVEQSLDLDFDLLATDLAPVDLLLQRCGRLQRHERGERRAPEVWIMAPEVREGLPYFPLGFELIYDPHVLLRTWLALHESDSISVPRDVSPLVEEVYGEGNPPLEPGVFERWKSTQEALERENAEHAKLAEISSISVPTWDQALAEMQGLVRAEDREDLHPSVQARTRLAEPSVPVVLLEERDGVPYLPNGDRVTFNEPSLEEVKDILRHSLTLNDRRVVFALWGTEPPAGWKKSPHLRFYRPLVLKHGRAEVGRHAIVHDPGLGVYVEEKVDANI